MGLFRSKKKPKSSRAQRRAEADALKAKAKLEARLAAKNEAKQYRAAAKAAAKQEKSAAKAAAKQNKSAAKSLSKKDKSVTKKDKSLAKTDLTRAKIIAKMQDKSDKNELKIAETNAKAAVDGKLLSEARIKRYISTGRLLAPVVVPMAYRAATVARTQLDAKRASRLGVPVAEVAQYSGHGGTLAARVTAARGSLDKLTATHPDAETKAFTDSVSKRLDDLTAAVSTSESMPTARRRTAHSAVARELDGIEADLLNRLGVTP
ncbi:DUF6474 family protein [Tsukamurella sp. 8F]|uniref:DUF6474 family protein n=1 Tax=unclassified Tsukamurella TaxID=2633480 RepID=UPI0023B93901|nr:MULTISPECIES: DUF6474 family protein [unclassified Tsukamurella]MDF0530592.1 DUF6474 family protein [Tsukamurella sp. 8J]MDF0587793.1 DUF6474 family protein [Tsukamurella sp. 8F]